MNILLLHGALGAAAQLEPLKDSLTTAGHACTVLEFSGHGNTGFTQAFSTGLFAGEVNDYLQHNQQTDIIFGYSMGGYVALYLAATASLKIKGIITLGTKFTWNREIAQKETAMLNPGEIEEKVPAFAAALANRHTAIGWQQNMQHTAHLMQQLGENPSLTDDLLAAIKIPVLCSVGDRDEMVQIQETVHAVSCMPASALCVLPATKHPVEKLRSEDAVYLVNGLLRLINSHPTTQKGG